MAAASLAIAFASSAASFAVPGRKVLSALSISATAALVCLYGLMLHAYWLDGGLKPIYFWRIYVEGVKGPIILFMCDEFTLVLLGISLIIGLLIMIYSHTYISPENREHPIVKGYSRYYGLMLLFIGSMIGVALSGNLVTLLIFYEITGICSCFLIAFYGTPKAVRAGYLAFILTHIGSFSFLAAVMITYLHTHSVSYSAPAVLGTGPLACVGALMLVAALAKSAQLPLYMWLPEAMVAPTTVSAYLHAAAMVKVGVFTYLRFCQYIIANGVTSQVIAWSTLVLALATMFFGAFNYYRQRDLKRLLAWSTIVQLSIIMLALGIALMQVCETPVYVSAYHMWNHSFAKALLFLTVGAMAYLIGRRDLNALKGLARRPGIGLLAYTWLIGGLAISAIPPFGCFFSKLALLFTGLHGPIQNTISVILMMFESYLLTLPIFIKLGTQAFREEPEVVKEALIIPKPMAAVLISLAIASVLSGFLTPIKIPWW